MAKLPDAQSLGPRPTPVANSTILSSSAGQQMAQAEVGLGNVIHSVGIAQTERQDKLSYASAKSALLQKDLQIRQDLSQEPDYATYAEKYKTAMDQAKTDAMKALGPNFYKDQLSLDATDISMRGNADVAALVQKKEADHGIATLNALIDTNRNAALSSADPATRASIINATNEAILGAQDKGYISEVQAGAARSKFTESYAKGSLELMAPAERIHALDNIKPGSPLAFLQPDDRAALKQDAQRDLLVQQAKADAARTKANEAFNSDFEIALRRGQKNYSDIEQAYKEGKISINDRTQYTVWLDQNMKKMQDQQAAILRVDHAGVDGPPLDPTNPDDRKAVNEHFDLAVQNWADLPADQVIDRSVAYAAQKGIVPDRLKSVVDGGLRSNNPDQQVTAAETLQRLRTANPQLLHDFNQQAISRGNVIDQYVNYGMKPDEAVKKADELARVDENTKDARSKEYAKLATADYKAGSVTPLDVAKIKLADEFKQGGLLFGSTPAVETAVASEYTQIAQSEYERTGNFEAAQKTAMDSVQRQWGVTRIGDGEPKLMKFAPEKFYSVPSLTPSENADWMQKQLETDVQDAGGMFSSNVKGRLSLIPSPTVISKDGLPTYSVVLNGDDGIPRVITDPTGKPLTWQPDFQTSDAAKKIEADQKAIVDKARVNRDRIQKGLGPLVPGSSARGSFGRGSVNALPK